MSHHQKFYINGEWVEPLEGTPHQVINPATEEVLTTIQLGGQADTDRAVLAAKTAFETWSLSSKAERVELLENIRAVYLSREDDLVEAISQEIGAPIDFTRAQQTPRGLMHVNGFIRALKNFEFERVLEESTHDMIRYEGIGVAAMITPWNWPINQISLKVFPAIAVGATTVLKPSEISPINAVLFAEILHEAGTPKGVFNMIQGDGPGVGSQLSAHKDVDMISFTGSTRAGRLISKASADTVKRVTLELGGKGANIIFADADENAVKRGVRLMMNNTGQSCNAPSRMLVERKIYDAAVEEAARVADQLAVDDPSKPGRHIGSLTSQVQFDKVQTLIEIGLQEGARLVAGGLGRPEHLSRGFFARPTVFADVSNEMTIAREEIFGPVLVMIPFETEAEAYAIANDTDYGLANYVQTQDSAKAKRAARALRAGMIRLNGHTNQTQFPFGGMKQSGNGREGGIWGLEDFCEIKHIAGWPA